MMCKKNIRSWAMLIIFPLSFCSMLLITCSLVYLMYSDTLRQKPGYYSPPASFQGSDVAGIWEVRYSGDHRITDRLVIRKDGLFQQIYRHQPTGYVYETPWNEWWMERFLNGRVRLHLRGARYYLGGKQLAERDGLSPVPDHPDWKDIGDRPFIFYDPIAEELVQMVGELVLNVRVDSSGNLILMHMWTSGDRGFPLFGKSWEEFHRIETP